MTLLYQAVLPRCAMLEKYSNDIKIIPNSATLAATKNETLWNVKDIITCFRSEPKSQMLAKLKHIQLSKKKVSLLTAHSLISSSQFVREVRTLRNWSHNSRGIITFKLALIQVTISVWKMAGASFPPNVSAFFFGGVSVNTNDVICKSTSNSCSLKVQAALQTINHMVYWKRINKRKKKSRIA